MCPDSPAFKKYLKDIVKRSRRRWEKRNPEEAGTKLREFIYGWSS